MDLTNRKPTQMSGVSFGGPFGPKFELFLANYCVILLNENNTFSLKYNTR
jgi:hypothetical protein